MENNYYYGYDTAAVEKATNVMIKNVYLWMCGALAITGLTAYYVANNPAILSWMFGNPWIVFALIVAELGLVIGLSASINRINALTATIMFLAYSVINGMTLSTIFLVYEIGSITSTFFVTAGTFGAMAIYGSVTNKDLTRIGNLCIMAVIGLIIAALVNLFIKSSMMDMVVSGVGVLVFVGLTAYDAQKIKNAFYSVAESDEASKYAVIGALELYLDFVNLFLYLLRFFGKRN